MSEHRNKFDTGVESSTAVLPGRPAYWSYSALKEIEACPRRYSLSRADYPELWERRGYPTLPVIPAMFGDVVHGALDTIVRALVAAECDSPRSPSAVAVLKELGGYTAVTELVLATCMEQLDGNPRIDPERRRRIGRSLEDRIPEARAQVQGYLSRITLPEAISGDASSPERSNQASSGERCDVPNGPAFGRRNAELGVHSELTLADENLRLMGRVDLLTVTNDDADILDYKTGAADPSHVDQLHLYALLWDLDRVVNPDHIPVGDLTAAYPGRDVVVSAPDASTIRALEETVRQRIANADSSSAVNPPEALPSADNCGTCRVRQLCDAYWSSITPDPGTLTVGTWFDYEGTVGTQNGSRSWWMAPSKTGISQFLLRTAPNTQPLVTGSRIRVLGIRLDEATELGAAVAVMTASSEVFKLRGEVN